MSSQKPSQSISGVADKLDALATQLQASAEALRSSQTIAEDQRSKIVTSAEGIMNELKQPMEHLLGTMVNLTTFCSLRLFLKWNLLDKIPATGSVSYKELADGIGAEKALISRFGAVLVSAGILRETEQGKVSHTAHSAVYTSPKSPMGALVCHGFDTHLAAMGAVLAYFDKFGLREPTGKLHTMTAFALGHENLTMWEILNRNPEMLANTMTAMAAMASKAPMTGVYDFNWVVSKMENDPDRALVVDVGGGKGHALQAICEATPGLPMNRCVLEDHAPVLKEAEASATGLLTEVQRVPLDFHSEQPVKNALIYYIRRCLHDYGDDDCIDILHQISSAMASDSRLLIVEQVMSDPPSPMGVVGDIMMAMIGGKERTLEGFKDLTSRAALEIVEAHRSPGTDWAVIECRRSQ